MKLGRFVAQMARKLGNDLLSQFFLSAWHWLPPSGCSTRRFAL